MEQVRHVLFYNDSAEFGGHEVMTLRGLQALVGTHRVRVSVMFYSGNDRLAERLNCIRGKTDKVDLLPMSFYSRSLQTVRSLLGFRDVRKIQCLMEQARPEAAVISQGRIEIGSAGLLAARRARIRTISYIPMAHPVSSAGRQVAVNFRERINRHFYRLPNKFITISEGSRRMLVANGTTSEIAVVPNCIDRIHKTESARERFRTALGLEREDYVVGILGRIIFRQKAQDFVLRFIKTFRSALTGSKFLFIGDGKDAARLQQMINEGHLDPVAKIVPWNSCPSEVYAGIDMLLIPSNFEGVPLVMLEAMSCGLPIVASNVDGMAEFLPPEWLFPPGNSQNLLDTLLRVKQQDLSIVLDKHRMRVADECDVQKFEERFARAVLE